MVSLLSIVFLFCLLIQGTAVAKNEDGELMTIFKQEEIKDLEKLKELAKETVNDHESGQGSYNTSEKEIVTSQGRKVKYIVNQYKTTQLFQDKLMEIKKFLVMQ